ncbi:hypothetical protein VIOR3934_05244 [Vibrio orientalis CIP 102891 = ATCC 33934]|uniref:DUF2867 domain-containing protein n=2 Tax=Vibrio orientalis TaxID=28175 RepID=C9QFA4_VIBOR|nr:hypothetical protein VIA_002034 [Vibrio orientalis CIP 102891 = ATCC 33934]EGU52996.1 hypothetical protein VIOR3934_05244 [Vibrio orientalis CIP 102891 = ATCC 33934]
MPMELPANADIHPYLPQSYFADSHSIELSYRGESALEIYFEMVSRTPKWVNFLMDLRNRIVSKLGLKHLGRMADLDQNKPVEDYKVGDQVGIFSIVSLRHNEVVVEDCDKHLNVRLSFLLVPNGNQVTLHATTVVHVKNTFGKVYMFFVAPVHKVIVPKSLNSLIAR